MNKLDGELHQHKQTINCDPYHDALVEIICFCMKNMFCLFSISDEWLWSCIWPCSCCVGSLTRFHLFPVPAVSESVLPSNEYIEITRLGIYVQGKGNFQRKGPWPIFCSVIWVVNVFIYLYVPFPCPGPRGAKEVRKGAKQVPGEQTPLSPPFLTPPFAQHSRDFLSSLGRIFTESAPWKAAAATTTAA